MKQWNSECSKTRKEQVICSVGVALPNKCAINQITKSAQSPCRVLDDFWESSGDFLFRLMLSVLCSLSLRCFHAAFSLEWERRIVYLVQYRRGKKDGKERIRCNWSYISYISTKLHEFFCVTLNRNIFYTENRIKYSSTNPNIKYKRGDVLHQSSSREWKSKKQQQQFCVSRTKRSHDRVHFNERCFYLFPICESASSGWTVWFLT